MRSRLVPWADADLTLGSWLLETSPTQFAALERAGLDFVIFDCQHSLVDEAAAAAFLTRLAGTLPLIVRASALDAALIGRLADAGADGVIVPGIESAADAARLVAALRYPPSGVRSYGPQRSDLGTDPRSIEDRVAAIPLIESARAISDIDAICATPGVDAIFIGPADLAISLGIPLAEAFGSPTLHDAVRRVRAASASAGLPLGIHAPDAGTARVWRDFGVDAVAVGSATRLLERGARALVDDVRGSDPVNGPTPVY